MGKTFALGVQSASPPPCAVLDLWTCLHLRALCLPLASPARTPCAQARAVRSRQDIFFLTPKLAATMPKLVAERGKPAHNQAVREVAEELDKFEKMHQARSTLDAFHH